VAKYKDESKLHKTERALNKEAARQKKGINIACVWAGGAYPIEYVYKLYHMVHRNSRSFAWNFNIFTDNEVDFSGFDSGIMAKRPIKIHKLAKLPSPHMRLWWHKMQLFSMSNEWKYDTTLYFDLDVVIISKLLPFIEHQRSNFCILQDFNRQGNPTYNKCNSSIMRWKVQDHFDMYAKWTDECNRNVMHLHGDQDWITDHLGDDRVWWPREWALSYKWELNHGGLKHMGPMPFTPDMYHTYGTGLNPPKECSVIVFHGKPDPHDLTDKVILDNWK